MMNTASPKNAERRTNVANCTHTATPARSTTGFFFYHSWLDDIAELPLDVQNEVVIAVVQYAASQAVPTEISPAASVAFKFCKRIIDYDLQRREEGERRTKKGGRSTSRNTTTKDPQSAENDSILSLKSKKIEDESLKMVEVAENEPILPFGSYLSDGEGVARPKVADFEPLSSISTPQSETSLSENGKVVDFEPLSQNSDAPYYNQESRITNPECTIPSSSSFEEGEAKEEDGASQFSSNGEDVAEVGDEDAALSQSSRSRLSQPSTLEEAEAYWKQEKLKSSAKEFFDYYEARGWKNRKGEVIHSWKMAARNWERHFLAAILPLRQKEEAERITRQLCEDNATTAARERRRQQQEREADYDEWQRRAVSPEEGRRAFQQALLETGGDAQAAIELLKRRR